MKRLRFKATPAAVASPDSTAALLLTYRGNVSAMVLNDKEISMTVSDGVDQPRARRLKHDAPEEAARHFAALCRNARLLGLVFIYVGPPLDG